MRSVRFRFVSKYEAQQLAVQRSIERILREHDSACDGGSRKRNALLAAGCARESSGGR